MTSSNEKLFTFDKVEAYVKNVNISGLQATNEEYLRRNLGDIFKATNFSDIIKGTVTIKKNFLNLGCFKEVDVIIDSSSDNSELHYDIKVDVKELGNIGGGIHTNFGNNEGSLSTSIKFPNLFGKGEKVCAEYTCGTRNHIDYRISYACPFDYNPNKNLDISVFRTLNDYSWSKYKEKLCGLSIDVIKPFKYTIRDNYVVKGNHIYTYEGFWRNLICNLDSPFEVREHSGHSLKSSVKYTNVVDERDSNTLPTKGGYLKQIYELAGLGGDVGFFRFISDYQYSTTFFENFTTQLSFSKGFILPFKNENIAINDRFFLGGPLTLRGFTNRGAGLHKDDSSLGNDAYWLFGAHLYTPLPLLFNNKSLKSWLKTHSFINFGNLFSINELRSLDQVNNRLEYLIKNSRLSIGTGVVIAFGNVARIELNYVWPIWKMNSDKASEGFQFGIGIHFN